MRRIAVAFLTLALSVACARSHTINVAQPIVVAGTELKPGEYRLDLEGGKIRLRNGTVKVEANVRAETVEQTIRATRLRLEVVNGKYQLKEIQLGGTNTRLVLD